MQGHKRSLNLVAEAQWLSPDAREEIARLEREAFASDDLREGMAVFAEKRNPNFKGTSQAQSGGPDGVHRLRVMEGRSS